MPEPMSAARLAEIEEDHQGQYCQQEPCFAIALITEVRRLRCALRLSEGSRGVPVSVGRD